MAAPLYACFGIFCLIYIAQSDFFGGAHQTFNSLNGSEIATSCRCKLMVSLGYYGYSLMSNLPFSVYL